MRLSRSALVWLVLLLSPVVSAETTVFRNVAVLPMDSERVVTGQDVLVVGERIVAVEPDIAAPEGAVEISGENRFLMPGLAEMHGHVPRPEQGSEFTRDVLFLYLANGITTVRGMLGAPGQLALREQANSGALPSPTLYLAGPSFNGRSVASPEAARTMVSRQHAEGWNLLKVHPGLTRAQYDAMAETAHELGIRFGGHVPQDVGLMRALTAGQETFDHMDGYTAYLLGSEDGVMAVEDLRDAVIRTVEAGAWIVPTMALWEVLLGTHSVEELNAYEELQYMPPDIVAGWARAVERIRSTDFDMERARRIVDARNLILGAMARSGVKLLMGTDAPQIFSVPGFSLHRELEVMGAAGMSNYFILRTGTANVGACFANEDRFGLVAPGHRADLLLLDGNPFDDLSHLKSAGVMARGHWWSRSEIERILASIAAKHKR